MVPTNKIFRAIPPGNGGNGSGTGITADTLNWWED